MMKEAGRWNGQESFQIAFGSDTEKRKERKQNWVGSEHDGALTNSQPIQQELWGKVCPVKEKWQALQALAGAARNCWPQIKSEGK